MKPLITPVKVRHSNKFSFNQALMLSMLICRMFFIIALLASSIMVVTTILGTSDEMVTEKDFLVIYRIWSSASASSNK